MKTEVCGCCELPPDTPLTVSNRPGLDSIVYRAGTYSTFRASMLQRLSRQSTLAGLRTRDDDDFAITCIDMWATVADVLTFYQERIANEAFLRTSRLRDSVLRMARLIDYQLRPGVAASARLVFTLERGAAITLPVALRVQSVPTGEEKPQIYETLESVGADARVNQLRVLPVPQAFNPLVKGGTQGLLAPGDDGRELAQVLTPGTRMLLYTDAGVLELLTVRALAIEEERLTLSWSGPIQGTGWDIRSNLYAFERTYRVFGCNAPAQYVEPVTVSGRTDWLVRVFSSFSLSTGTGDIPLDGKYDGIAVGAQLLISVPGNSNRLVTVLAVWQGQAVFLGTGATTSPVQDTVTWIRVSNPPASISDRRTAVVYELKGPRVRLWGYQYPERLDGTTALVAGRRIDASTIEIGAGTRLTVDVLATGRDLILRDADPASPALTTNDGATIIGLDVAVAPTSDDGSTAAELLLDAGHGTRVIALRSDILPPTFILTATTPSVNITVGAGPARTVVLFSHPTAIGAAVNALQAGIDALVPDAPELAGCRVTQSENTIILVPAIAGASLSVAPSPADATTARELGLLEPRAIRVDALRSGDLSTFPAVSNPHPQLNLSFGPLGSRLLQFSGPPGGLVIACSMLRNALHAVDASPAFKFAVVVSLEDSILVVPGTGGSSVREYLAIALSSAPAAPLSTRSAVLLGNVARASHGESVRNEVLGDGDAALAFQHFDLQKQPLTRVSSAMPGGTDSTLQVNVNGVAWTEVASVYAQPPNALVYTTRVADDGTVRVTFGDGRTGARLPSGRSNVAANYRQGSGLVGRVGGGALRTALDLPNGLKSVSNPLSATGGADPEVLEQARENAPTTVRTFGRAVSLRDFEDLVRSSGEVAKAFATWVWSGEARAVHLTIAAQGGLPFAPEDLVRIHASVDAARDPNHTLFLDNFIEVAVQIAASVLVKPNYVASTVASAVRVALLEALSFDTLGFGQPLALSEVVAIMQEVDGVLAVDVDLFHFKDRSAAFLAKRGASTDPVQRSLRIFPARPSGVPFPPVLPAEMASIEVPADDVQIVTKGGLPGPGAA